VSKYKDNLFRNLKKLSNVTCLWTAKATATDMTVAIAPIFSLKKLSLQKNNNSKIK
jgi:hypothetical protein